MVFSDLSNSDKSDFLNLISATLDEKDQRVAFLTLPKPIELSRAQATVNMEFGNGLLRDCAYLSQKPLTGSR